MYVVAKEKVAKISVEWNEIDGDGYQITNSIHMKVELVPYDDYEEFIKGFSGMTSIEDGSKAPPTVREFALRVARGWDGIVGEDKRPFSFTKANLGILLQAPGFMLGFGLSYIKGWSGQGALRRKNSAGSAAGGPAAERPNRRAPRARRINSKS